MVYGLPSKVAQTTIQFSNESFSNDFKKTIPIWIKDVGGFWCSGQISDVEFISGIEYLVNIGTIRV